MYPPRQRKCLPRPLGLCVVHSVRCPQWDSSSHTCCWDNLGPFDCHNSVHCTRCHQLMLLRLSRGQWTRPPRPMKWLSRPLSSRSSHFALFHARHTLYCHLWGSSSNTCDKDKSRPLDCCSFARCIRCRRLMQLWWFRVWKMSRPRKRKWLMHPLVSYVVDNGHFPHEGSRSHTCC